MEKKETPTLDICLEHNLPYYYVCLIDQKQLCPVCLLFHKTHDFILIANLSKSEEMQKQIDSLDAIEKEVLTLVPSISQLLKMWGNLYNKINAQKNATITKVVQKIEFAEKEKLCKISDFIVLLEAKILICKQIVRQIESKRIEATEVIPKIKQGYFSKRRISKL